MNRIILTLLSAMLLFSAAGCGLSDTTEPTKPEKAEYVITREGNPSTGYDWFVTVEDSSVLSVRVERSDRVQSTPSITSSLNTEEESEDESELNAEVPIVGAPIQYRFIFNALKEGTTKISLTYEAPVLRDQDEGYIEEHYEAAVTVVDNQFKIDMQQVDAPSIEETAWPDTNATDDELSISDVELAEDASLIDDLDVLFEEQTDDDLVLLESASDAAIDAQYENGDSEDPLDNPND